MSKDILRTRRRHDYPFHLEYRTRCYDSIINAYLTQHCSLHPPTATEIGLIASSSSLYLAPLDGFPGLIDLGLRVTRLGSSSVEYEVGVFGSEKEENTRTEEGGRIGQEKGDDDIKAVGTVVHVFVDRVGMRPRKEGMGEDIRRGLARLLGSDATVGGHQEDRSGKTKL
ncbi:MAG: hypothetical protein M1817_005607 [Caeruleum heppii]|nr:MAG: hypothetical protein M1817_005607 [Caeruleum heppii]